MVFLSKALITAGNRLGALDICFTYIVFVTAVRFYKITILADYIMSKQFFLNLEFQIVPSLFISGIFIIAIIKYEK